MNLLQCTTRGGGSVIKISRQTRIIASISSSFQRTRTQYISFITFKMSDKSPTNKRPESKTTAKNPSIPWSTRNKSESSTDKKSAKKPPSSPSPSASIILISPTSKILLLHRVQTSSSFPSAHVFPGGNLESSDGALAAGDTNIDRHKDSDAYRTGAIRELFEETGILLARESSETQARLLRVPLQTRLKARKEIHDHKIDIKSWLETVTKPAVLDTASLIPFTRWITPTNVPKRFTTQMYLYFVPLAATEEYESLIATGDEVETMEPEWMFAHQWLDRARSGEIILFPPQFLLLSLVSRFLDPSLSSLSSSSPPTKNEIQRRREQLISFVESTKDGIAWRDKVISPTALSFTRDDGRTVLGLDKPGPELRDAFKDGVVKGDEEFVVLVRFSKEGPRDVEIRDRRETLREEREGKSRL